MASVWQFASTRGLIFLADAQRDDPEELQVLDIFLVSQLVVKASLHGRIIKALGIPEGKYGIIGGVVQARSLTTRRSCPGSPRLCDNSRSDSPMYVRYTHTAYTSLMLVVQPTVHAQQQLAS